MLRGPPLVGRQEELAILEAELALAAQGEFRTVLLLGEPGVGKTRLAGEVVCRYAGSTVTLLGRAYPFGRTASFVLWSEALERQLREMDVDDVVRLYGGFLDDLASLLRSVAAARGSAPEREPPRFRLLDALVLLLANLAQEAALLVVLDDVHLADASSWEALLYLARNLSGTPILVVLAARSGELFEQPPAATSVPIAVAPRLVPVACFSAPVSRHADAVTARTAASKAARAGARRVQPSPRV